MFSQYSWWDFIKFVLILAVPYYAFVLWKYYREDIRELINNRGKASPDALTQTPDDDEDEDVDDTGLYAVKTYADPAPSLTQAKQPANSVKQEAVSKEPVAEYSPETHDVDLPDGVVVNEESGGTFDVGLATEVVRPAERSLAEVLNAARRVTADERGALTANDPNDAEAAEVATTINKQNGFDSLLSGVSFNR